MAREKDGFALDALDALWTLGARFSREDWTARFKPHLCADSAGRAWERLKRAMRDAGVPVHFEGGGRLGCGVVTFDRSARLFLEALLPPLSDDAAGDEEEGQEDGDRADEAPTPCEPEPEAPLARPAKPRRPPPPPVPPAALEEHARATWARYLVASPAAFARALEADRPDLWARRERAARAWYWRLASGGSRGAVA